MKNSSRRQFISKAALFTAFPLVSPLTGISVNVDHGLKIQDVAGITRDPSAATFTGNPLLQAILTGDKKSVESLLDEDELLINLTDKEGRSVYRIAILHNQPEIAAMLLSRGYAKDIFDYVTDGDLDSINTAVSQNPGVLNTISRFGYTPLQAAAEAGQVSVIDNLVGRGAVLDTNIRNNEHLSALGLGISYNDKDKSAAIAQALLGNGCNPNIAQKDNFSPLHCAAKTGNNIIARLLIRKGADVDHKDVSGKSAIDIANENNNKETASIIRQAYSIYKDVYITRYKKDKNGAGITRDDTQGFTQNWINRFVTYSHFDFKTVKEMYGKSPGLLMTRSTWDEIPVEAAAHLGNEPIANFLLDAGSPLSICTATMLGLTEQVKSMISLDPSVINERGAHDFPLLFYTTYGKEKPELAELILNNKIDVNINVRGRSALMESVLRDHLIIAELLLTKGANPNLKCTDFQPGTPLDFAIKRKNTDMIALLKKYGAMEIS